MPKWTLDSFAAHITVLLAERDVRYMSEFHHIKENVDTALVERKDKDKELNDVRLRFVPREAFETYKEEQAKKVRGAMIFMFVEALTIIALGLSLIGMLMRDARV